MLAFVFLALAVTVNALVTPHAARSLHLHRALAARVAAPEPAAAVVPIAVKPIRKRQSGGRCRAQPASSVPATPTPTPTPTPAQNTQPTPSEQAPPPPAVNAAPAPPADTPAPAPVNAAPAPPPPPAAPPAQSGGGGGGSGSMSGDGTFYDIGLGACGIVNSGNDKIVAVSHAMFDSYPGYNGANPNNNPICGKQIRAFYQGQSTVVTVTDRCGGCEIFGSLDFSPFAFSELTNGNFGLGRIQITWDWL